MTDYDEATEHRTCRDCGADFEFTRGEQQFFEAHELQPPQRCRACRALRRAERAQAPAPTSTRA